MAERLEILCQFEELLRDKLELSKQVQSLVDTSAQSLDAFRIHCSTSRELIKDEIRMLEGKLVQRIGRQLAIRKALKKHFDQISSDLHLSQCLETDLDLFVAQREEYKISDGQGTLSKATLVSSIDPESTLVDQIKLMLHEELSRHPRLEQWLEIVGLQPVCIKAVMELVSTVEDLLSTSESKLKAVIVQASQGCSCPRPSPTGVIPLEDPSQVVPDSALEDSSKDNGGLKVDSAGGLKEKGKLPFHVREDVRRLITACRLLRIYSERLLTEDNELKELYNLNPTKIPYLTTSNNPSQSGAVNGSSTSSSATPPNNLVRKESVKSLYWDSWRTRPTPALVTANQPISYQVPQGYCSVHSDQKYPTLGGDQRLPSMLSSFSSEDNYLTQNSQSVQSNPMIGRGSGTQNRLTSQSSIISSVSTATTTGDEGDVGSTYADVPSASSSCANSVFPSANNILQLVQQYESSPGTLRRLQLTTQDALSEFPSLNADSSRNIRSSSSTPSLLLSENNLKPKTQAINQANSTVNRKELVKFTKSNSLESSLRTRLSDEGAGDDEGARAIVPLSETSGNGVPSAHSFNHHIEKQPILSTRRMHHSIHHVFKNHFFITLSHCTYCEKSLRALGRKCRHCKFRCHADCAEKAPPSCGLPDGLVQEYYKSIHPGNLVYPGKHLGEKSTDSEAQVEEDDETLQPYSIEYKRRQSELAELREYDRHKEPRHSTTSSKSPEFTPPKSPWRTTFKLLTSKMSPPATTPDYSHHAKISKQRSHSIGNVLEGIRDESNPKQSKATLPSQVRSPISRRFSGSFSLPRNSRDHRKRRPMIAPKKNDDLSRKPIPQREARIFSDPSIQPRNDTDKRRTASASSGVDPQSPAHTSMDSLSAPSSSYGSSGQQSSVPPSPGTFSRSGSSGPPMSPLAFTSFAHPGRTYRSFMRTVKDQFKFHFHWPIPKDENGKHLAESSSLPKTPLSSGRRKSKGGESMQGSDGNRGGNMEEEIERSEALDDFPAAMPRTFPTVLVSGSDNNISEGKQVPSRRYSLLEDELEMPVEKIVVSKTQVVSPVEVEEENEPSYSGDNSDQMKEPIPWRRQQSLYLRELSIPYKELVFGEKLGQGTFGQVYRGKWHGDVAIKVLNSDYLYNDAEELHEAFKLDLANLRKTRHDNLVLFMGACTRSEDEQHQQIIITSLLSRGLPGAGSGGSHSITLHDLIHDNRSKTLTTPYKAQLNRLLIIASQICQGMGYLHRRGIVHKDLKSQNIFVTHEKCFITDYGLFSVSKMFQHGRSDDFLWFPKNWLCYLAPEICRHLQTPRQQKAAFIANRESPDPHTPIPFTIFSDVYAFGTILYELCTGTFPLLFSAYNAQRLYQLQTSDGVVTPGGLETPLTPSAPQTPVISQLNRQSRPPDPNLPGSLESALYLIASGNHPIFRTFKSRSSKRTATNTAPQSDSVTPLTPVMRSPNSLLSPSIEEAAAKELTELISICWSPKIPSRKEFAELYSQLERVPKKSLARSPSHPVHGNANFPKETIYY